MHMNIKIKLLSVGLLSFGISSIGHAGIIVYESVEGVLESEVAGVTTINFEDGLCGYSSCSGDFQVLENIDGSVNQSAPPFMATSIGDHWLTVPNPIANGTATFGLGDDYNYFGLFWGSIDNYNTISFLNDGDIVASFTGSELAPLLDNGDQNSWGSNRFINFTFSEGDFYDSVVLASTNFAFETDNHAFGNVSVPEPATLGLLVLGIAGIGAARRKKSA